MNENANTSMYLGWDLDGRFYTGQEENGVHLCEGRKRQMLVRVGKRHTCRLYDRKYRYVHPFATRHNSGDQVTVSGYKYRMMYMVWCLTQAACEMLPVLSAK